jgi:hypothetical protein
VFDFGEIEESSDAVHFGAPVLWASRPGRHKGETVLMPIYRVRFLDAMIKGEDLIGVKGAMIGPMRITYDFYQRCLSLPADQLAQVTGLRSVSYPGGQLGWGRDGDETAGTFRA